MLNLKKGLPVLMIERSDYRKTFFILIPLILFAFHVWPSVVVASDNKRSESHYKRYKNGKEHYDYNEHKEQQVKKEDEGNEVTGEIVLWLLVAANLTVALSILMKSATRYFPLEPETKSSIKRFNQLQKKYLMQFHYVLNPLSLCIAIFHFLLSSCRKTSLPEWGLIFVIIMVFLGLMVKFTVTPKWIRRFVYRLHTSSSAFSVLILVLVVGHLIID
ncbi:MAG: hypothetical protein MUO43_16225 [Desulfobacterales bacterium]|nr:hypothetical protein [Desulfobacterales bacterium]